MPKNNGYYNATYMVFHRDNDDYLTWLTKSLLIGFDLHISQRGIGKKSFGKIGALELATKLDAFLEGNHIL